MKYNLTARVFGIVFYKMFDNYYKEHFPRIDRDSYKKQIMKEYKAMVLRTPGIGGRKNWLEPNLTMGCIMFSICKVVDNMTPKIFDEILADGLSSDFMKNLYKRDKKKGTIFSEKMQNKTYEQALKSQSSTYEMDWKYTYEKGDNEFRCTYTKCGLCELARRENMMEYMPCLCKTDYINYANKGAELIRTKTLGNGDDCCDFYVKRIK